MAGRRGKANAEGGRRVRSLAGLIVLLFAAALSWLNQSDQAPETEAVQPSRDWGQVSAAETASTKASPGPGAAADRASPRAQARPPIQLIEHARVVDQRTGRVYDGPVDLSRSLARIAAGESYPHRNDGAVFQNRPLPGRDRPELPRKARGYYREYVHPTPGIDGPGPQRIVVGQGGEYYYTPDHYQSFIALQ